MRFISLFSGIGGFDLGFEITGLKCVAQVEIDATCRDVLARHWPEVERYEDIGEVQGQDLPQAEIICAGVPCQDWSVAGKRAGIQGARSGLFFQFARIIKEMRDASNGQFPRVAVFENVQGLFSAHRGRDFAIVLNALAECGAVDIAWRTIDAQHWVPQRRRRVFIVACFPPYADGRAGNECAAEILSFAEGVQGHSAPSREAGARVAQTISPSVTGRSDSTAGRGGGRHLVASTLGANSGRCQIEQPYVAWALQERDHKGPDSDTKDGHLIVTHALRSEGADASEDGTGRGTPLVASTLPADHRFDSNVDNLQAASFASETGKGFWSEGAARLRAQPGGMPENIVAYTQGVGVRRLTPREAERLQGFPDDFTRYRTDGSEISDSARYRLLGNAVAVPVAEWIGKRLMDR